MFLAFTRPLLKTIESVAANVTEAQDSLEKMEDFDACNDIFTVIAHDQSVVGVVGVFPNVTANAWKEHQWREKGMWGFLADFEEAARAT